MNERSSLGLESVLWEVVSNTNKEIKADECSLFLLDEETDKYVLRESTRLTPFLNNYCINITETEKGRYEKHRQSDISPAKDKNNLKNIGITIFTILNKQPELVPDVRQDVRWSSFGLKTEQLRTSELEKHCEIPHDRLLSLIEIPLEIPRFEKLFGVFRAARTKDSGPFTPEDIKNLTEYINTQLSKIYDAVALSKLIEIGSILDLKELCSRVVSDLRRIIIEGEGCSIFLLDEEAFWKEKRRIYRCEATTGLLEVKAFGKRVVQNLKDVFYEYSEDEADASITLGVIRNKQNIIISNTDREEEFQRYGLTRRKSGPGKYSEYTEDKNGEKTESGSMIAAPLFYSNYRFTKQPPVGVIRITKSKGKKFWEHEIRLFLSFAEKLSKIITNIAYVGLLNKLSVTGAGGDLDTLFSTLVQEVLNLVGAEGCSVFIMKDDKKLHLKETRGALEGRKTEILPYDPNISKKGFTSWVAYTKEPFWYNSPYEIEIKYGNRKPYPEHSGRTNECEIIFSPPRKLPDRFMALPILEGEQVLGVLRIPKSKEDNPFSERDLELLNTLCTKVAPIIKEAQKREKDTKKRETEISNLFSTLYSGIQGMQNIIFRDDIKEFFSRIFIDPDLSVSEHVLNFTTSLWDKYLRTPFPLLEELEPLEDILVKEVPRYREHFIHQNQVFLVCWLFFL